MDSALNLIRDEWIPVRCRSGATATIRPGGLLDREDPPVTLLWPRPDMNLAGLALWTGLVHASMPPADADAWEELVEEPPDADALDAALEPLARWFALDGDGPRFMQDLEPLEGEFGSVDKLFVDSSGGKTVKDNADLAVRRDRYARLGRPAAAMALYAFQQFAPAGGRGNRTSMCGGGPMYTFVEPSSEATLWQTVWANVPYGVPVTEADAPVAFPWTARTRTSEAGSEIHQPELAEGRTHCAVWFGVPRRIRLRFGDEPGRCELTGDRDERPVDALVQRPYGNNYGLWRHPASPYYRQKAGDPWLPVHPKPGRFGYRHYLGIALQSPDTDLRRRADTVREVASGARRTGGGYPRVLVGGWAMDNMKPLDYVLGRAPVPLAKLRGPKTDAAARAVRAATLAAGELVGALKDALGVDEKGTGIVSDARLGFFDDTERAFHAYLAELAVATDDTPAPRWLEAMREVVERRFDDVVESLIPELPPEAVTPIAKARRRLAAAMRGRSARGRELFELLRIDPPPKGSAGGSKRADDSPTPETTS